MITDKDELREAIKLYTTPKIPQWLAAQEMGINRVYLNQFLKGKNGVGGESFINRANTWLSKQKTD